MSFRIYIRFNEHKSCSVKDYLQSVTFGWTEKQFYLCTNTDALVGWACLLCYQTQNTYPYTGQTIHPVPNDGDANTYEVVLFYCVKTSDYTHLSKNFRKWDLSILLLGRIAQDSMAKVDFIKILLLSRLRG